MKLLSIFSTISLLSIINHGTCLNVFWNAPTEKCKKYSVDFTGIPQKFNINQNHNDTINGNHVGVLKNPGLYPYIEKDAKGNLLPINGGVPQQVDLTKHLEALEEDVEKSVDPNFSGYGIIGMYSGEARLWQYLYDQTNEIYKTMSYDLTDPSLNEVARKALAAKKYNEGVQQYIVETLKKLKELRPDAIWGYEDLPNCFSTSMVSNSSCNTLNQEHNDKLSWFWQQEDMLVQLMRSWDATNAKSDEPVFGTRMNEAKRIVSTHNSKLKITFYSECQTSGGAYRNKEVNEGIFSGMRNRGCDAVFIREYERNLDTKEKCERFLDHLNNVLGPVIYKYADPLLKVSSMPATNQTSTMEKNDDDNDDDDDDDDDEEKNPNFALINHPPVVFFYVIISSIILLLP